MGDRCRADSRRLFHSSLGKLAEILLPPTCVAGPRTPLPVREVRGEEVQGVLGNRDGLDEHPIRAERVAARDSSPSSERINCCSWRSLGLSRSALFRRDRLDDDLPTVADVHRDAGCCELGVEQCCDVGPVKIVCQAQPNVADDLAAAAQDRGRIGQVRAMLKEAQIYAVLMAGELPDRVRGASGRPEPDDKEL
jgi:hypothetical protein